MSDKPKRWIWVRIVIAMLLLTVGLPTLFVGVLFSFIGICGPAPDAWILVLAGLAFLELASGYYFLGQFSRKNRALEQRATCGKSRPPPKAGAR
jgi:hypothetical protein